MKKISGIVLTILLTLGFVGQAQADWVVFQNIKAVHDSGNQVHFKTNTSDPSSPCIGHDMWALDKSNPNFDEIFKMLMTAYTAGSPGMVAGAGVCDSAGYKQVVGTFLIGVW